jgi:ADP-ribosyl-[dinitrogen reductase] hydrolase
MSLCTVRALSEGGFDPFDHMDRFVRWLTESSDPLCCETTKRSVTRYLEQKLASPLNKANPYQGLSRCPEDRQPADAGPLVRVFPLILACAAQPAPARRTVQSYVELTHGSPECVETAILLANVSLGLFYGKGKDLVLSGEATIEVLPLRVPAVSSLFQGDFMLKDPGQLVAKGSAARVLECALWALHKSHDFQSGMEMVLGLDPAANEASALYGLIAGIHYGVVGVPEKWLPNGAWLADSMVTAVFKAWSVA